MSEKTMQPSDIRRQWEGPAPGWARWEAAIAAWMEPAIDAMLTMAGPPGVRERLLLDSGFVEVQQRTMAAPLRMPSASEAR